MNLRHTIAILTTLPLAGCAGSQTRSASDPAPARRPTAIIADGVQVPMDDIIPILAERSGSVAVDELTLTMTLDTIAQREGIRPIASDLDFERTELFGSLADDGAPDRFDLIRARRGLGPTRLGALIRRNAILRDLIRAQNDHTTRVQSAQSRAVAIASAPRVSIRLGVFGSADDAHAARSKIVRGDPDGTEWRFAAQCLENSQHPSAQAGGLMATLSIDDPALPEIVRSSIKYMEPGSVTQVLQTPGGPALVYLRSTPETRPLSDSELARIRAAAKRAEEGRMMEALAQQILDRTEQIIMNPALRWSVEHQPER